MVRRLAILGALASIAVGIASRKIHLGIALWDKSFGDIVYAVMIGFLVLAARPSLSSRAVAVLAFGICFVLELFQLTGLARDLPRLVRFALGTTFAWHDVGCYIVGAVIVWGLCALIQRDERA